jgi:O-Antigen ligase
MLAPGFARKVRRRRRLLMLGLSALVGLVAAVANSGIIGGVPPKPRLHNLDVATATSYVDVDLPASSPSLARGLGTPPDDIQTFIKRAELLGRIMVTEPVLTRIAPRCGVAPYALSGRGWITADVPFAFTEPNSEQRASDIQASNTPYQIQVQAQPTVPVIAVYAQAPSVAVADCLANTAPIALHAYLQTLAAQEDSTQPLVSLNPLGPAQGAVVNGSATLEVAFLTFLTVFCLTLAGLHAIRWLRRRRGARAEAPGDASAPTDPDPRPSANAGDMARTSRDRREDSWPHTKRLTPWLLALFFAIIWLTPFNDISVGASLPVELRLDRLVLPFVVLAWILAMAAGGRLAPRVRLTWIHIALAALLACAFLSVVTDARYLNQTLELTLSLKKLPLMLAYVSLFVVTSSAVRRTELRPFLTYTLALAVLCAVGMIWEYHTRQHFFWEWTRKLLPGFLHLSNSVSQASVDNMGRRVVLGPADEPLEAVAMLTMALPIALVRLLQARVWRQRIVYGLSICALVAAMLATYRKSALIAPASVLLTIAYFRRRELLKLAPLGVVLLAMVTALSPGALGSTISQFTRSDAAAVPTVSDRTAAYDAIRPDVWTHLLLGRGWGSYDHNTYRILDSEILDRTIETGVIGLLAFVLVPVAVVGASRRTIAARDPETAPAALIGASCAVGFLVLAFLFDELAFPHPVYIFLYLVGLETVALQRARHKAGRPPEPSIAARPPTPAMDADVETQALVLSGR